MKTVFYAFLIIFSIAVQSAEKESGVEKITFKFEVNNEKKPSRKYFDDHGNSTEGSKVYHNDVFWIKNIYSEDGNYKLSIHINPDLKWSPKSRNGVWIQNKDDSPFKTSLNVRVTWTLSDGRQIKMPPTNIVGGLPYLSPNHEINYLNYIMSDINSEKQWGVKVEVPNREPIIFKDIKISGFRDAMIKFRSGKWEKKQID